jgi:undecaprenyl-diphosphatase
MTERAEWVWSRRGRSVVSFLVAIVVVRAFVSYISRHGFAPFAWYRIAAGIVALAWLMMR